MEQKDDFMKVFRDYFESKSLTFEYEVEIVKLQSKLLYAKFESLVDAGFTESQAMEIIKARGIDMLPGGGDVEMD